MEIPSAASSATGLAVVDKDGVIISANGAACQMLGVSLTELQGRSLLSLISDVSFDNGEGTGDEATPDSASQLMMRLCGGGTATLRNASSESRIRVAIRAEPTFDPASNELSTLVVILTLPVHPDVSGQSVARDRLILDQQRRAEQWLRKALSELRQRNAETSELLRSSRSALRVSDFRQKVKYIFDDCKRLIGAEAGYVLRCDGVPSVTETLLLDTGGLRSDSPLPLPMPVRGLMAEAFRTGRAVYENGFSHGGGAESIPAWHIPIDSILYAPLAVDGKVLGFLGLADKPGGFDEHDLELAAAFAELMAIAVRNNDEASRLEKSESRFRRLAENAPEIIVQYELRPVAGFSYITPIVTKMLGYSPEEFLGDPEMARKITHPDDLPLLEAHVSAASTVPVLCRWRHKDGRWIWIEQHSAHIRDDEGIVVAVVAIIRDVTEQKQAEDALMESEQRYRSVVAALEEGIILWSNDRSIV
ncbi:MAG: PAS domain S-box protein, partial [Actinobacteria bacterium]|nr:PAS domain S-box protein [Actinomycetota bacterium]